MRSFYGQLFLDIVARLGEAVPELAWIDHDWGQDQAEMRPMLAYPAALVDFAGTDYSELSGLSQWGDATVTVRLFFDSYDQSSAAAPQESREAAMEFYEIEHKVVEALHGWMPDGGYCQELIRTADASENRGDIGLRIRRLTFTTAFEAEAGD